MKIVTIDFNVEDGWTITGQAGYSVETARALSNLFSRQLSKYGVRSTVMHDSCIRQDRLAVCIQCGSKVDGGCLPQALDSGFPFMVIEVASTVELAPPPGRLPALVRVHVGSSHNYF